MHGTGQAHYHWQTEVKPRAWQKQMLHRQATPPAPFHFLVLQQRLTTFQVGLELAIFLPPLLECWDYGSAAPQAPSLKCC